MSQPALFTPLVIRDVTFRNRVWVSPMCQYSVVKRDGVPIAWHNVHLGSMAVGGAGLVMTESTAVEAIGRISPHDTGIWNDEQRDAWKTVVDFITSQGAVAGIQLGHAGRKASIYPDWDFPGAQGTMPDQEGGWQTVSASATAFDGYLPADELSLSDIDALVETWADAARRSIEAGFTESQNFRISHILFDDSDIILPMIGMNMPRMNSNRKQSFTRNILLQAINI